MTPDYEGRREAASLAVSVCERGETPETVVKMAEAIHGFLTSETLMKNPHGRCYYDREGRKVELHIGGQPFDATIEPLNVCEPRQGGGTQ